jgi:predicted RNA-binding protein with TRAM domain
MEEKRLYIDQAEVENDLYSLLQKRTLDELQHLSGEVWTDFNPHDPGVTTADIANYALTEVDYKLGFKLQDYLTDSKGNFVPEKYGLFLPEDVYPTTPVTSDDYRKLLLAEIPQLDNVDVVVHDKTQGNYDIKLYLSPFFKSSEDLVKQVRGLYHAHRNLCENLNEISFPKLTELDFHSELEIKPGMDATSIVVQIYWNIIYYLSGSIRMEYQDVNLNAELSMEEWMDGTNTDFRVIIPKQNETEQELYNLLMQIEGIKSFKTCYLIKRNDNKTSEKSGKNKPETISDFKEGYTIFIPKYQNELNVKVRIEGTEMPVNMERFIEELQALYFSEKSNRINREVKGKKADFSRSLIPVSTYRDVCKYRSIIKDYPECYHIEMNKECSENGMIPGSFEMYLKMYDWIIERGLNELGQLQDLLSIMPDTAVLSTMDVFSEGMPERDKSFDSYGRNVRGIKNRYLDFLDHLYGVDSNPAWMKDLSYYGETAEEIIKRRLNFLRHVASLTRTRAKAWNIYGERSEDNIPTLKAYISLLLGLNMDENISIGNILPSHNLILLGSKEEYKKMRDRLNSMLIDEKMLDAANIESIPVELPEMSEEEQLQMFQVIRHELMIFNTNLISGGLFRTGINIDNYKTVSLDRKEYLLAFWNEEDTCWLNMGRSNSKATLRNWANVLCYYLRELNRKCEAFYVVEHHLFIPAEPFKISLVLPDWTARFHSSRFKEIFRQLVEELLPAHINCAFYWLDVAHMQYFENSYQDWCKALSADYVQDEIKEYQTSMMDVLNESLKIEKDEI